MLTLDYGISPEAVVCPDCGQRGIVQAIQHGEAMIWHSQTFDGLAVIDADGCWCATFAEATKHTRTRPHS